MRGTGVRHDGSNATTGEALVVTRAPVEQIEVSICCDTSDPRIWGVPNRLRPIWTSEPRFGRHLGSADPRCPKSAGADLGRPNRGSDGSKWDIWTVTPQIRGSEVSQIGWGRFGRPNRGSDVSKWAIWTGPKGSFGRSRKRVLPVAQIRARPRSLNVGIPLIYI